MPMKGFLSDWWRDFFALTGFIAIVAQLAAVIRELFLTGRRNQARLRASFSTLRELTETLKEAYRETKRSNFHLGFHGFYIHLAISIVVATLAACGFWLTDPLPANPLGIIFFIGLFHDIFDLDDWIQKNKP